MTMVGPPGPSHPSRTSMCSSMMLSWSLRFQPHAEITIAIKKLKEKDRVAILTFCALEVHLYDKQASVLAFGIF